MTDRFDYEVMAIEADHHAEMACRPSFARQWRELARGYRMLSDFAANGQAVQGDETRDE